MENADIKITQSTAIPFGPNDAKTGRAGAMTPTGDCRCVHCGLSVPAGRRGGEDELSFCCDGCRGAYELIHGWGLDEFYALRDQIAAGGIEAVRARGSSFAVFDSDEFLGNSRTWRQASQGTLCRDEGRENSRLRRAQCVPREHIPCLFRRHGATVSVDSHVTFGASHRIHGDGSDDRPHAV